jgi:hypothetical protein
MRKITLESLDFVRTRTQAAWEDNRFKVRRENRVMINEDLNDVGYLILGSLQILAILANIRLQLSGSFKGFCVTAKESFAEFIKIRTKG